MSVRVNLLPGDVEERNRAARERAAVGAAAVAVVVVLAIIYFVQAGRVNAAEEQLETANQRVAEREAEVADLQEFQQLEQQAEQAALLLAAALGDEPGVAGSLQDFAAVFPSNAELDSLSLTFADPTTAPLGGVRPVFGTLTAAGRTLQGHAPGLERLLLELDKVATFSNVFFATSTLDEEGVSTFTVDLNLGEEVLTDRYADGLPEELR